MRLANTISIFALAATSILAQGPRIIEHPTVFYEDGKFGGWPANHGVWSWGNEILVGFEIGYFKDNPTGHDIDYSKPTEHVLARSLDGGKTWKIERPEGLKPPQGTMVADLPVIGGKPLRNFDGKMDFANPDFIISFRMGSVHDGQSRFYYSNDRGKNWDGPFRLPNFDQPGTAARTDYIINGKHDMLILITAAKSNTKEGRVMAARTKDGGKTWNFVSFVGPEVIDADYAIMPSTVKVGPTDLVSAIRRRHWIDIYRSYDNGESWTFVNQPVIQIGGNPPSMVRLNDGRLVLTYGYRIAPFGIRAKISKDNGLSWGEEIILRKDGGGGDLGYPRTVVLPDGKLVTAYYFNKAADKERSIESTIWDPGK